MNRFQPVHVLLAVAFLYAAAAFGWLQFRTPHLVDRDSYYHARISQMLPERGLSREFRWAQESVWRDRFSDKDFLFHLWLAPFCRGAAPIVEAKIAAWLLGCAILGVLTLIFVKNGFRAPALWIALVPALGNHFLFRMQEVRPHLLSVALLLGGVHVLLQGRRWWIFILGFIYAWSYASPHLLVVFAAIDVLARAAIERRWTWGGLPAAAAGVVAGLLIHPYFPNDLEQWWIINVRILGQAWALGGDAAIRLGAEFEPVTTRSLLYASTLVFLILVGIVLASQFRGEALRPRTKRLTAFMMGGFVMYCLSAKFVEYFAPLALLAGASAAEDLWSGRAWTRWRVALVLASAVLTAGLTVRSMGDTAQALRTYPGPNLAGAAGWIRANVPEGETIVHLDWGDFVQLFYFDPTHHYLVGLDPMMMYVRSPERMRMLAEMRSGKRPVDAGVLARTFDARYLVAAGDRQRQLIEAAGLRPEYEDPLDGSAVYPLAPPDQ
jgi:hypothetical protein